MNIRQNIKIQSFGNNFMVYHNMKLNGIVNDRSRTNSDINLQVDSNHSKCLCEICDFFLDLMLYDSEILMQLMLYDWEILMQPL